MTSDQKLQALRQWMDKNGVQAVIAPNVDPHNNEYPAPRWHARTFLSSMKGSSGTMAVTIEKSGLWTDSRYYEVAEAAIAGSEIEQFRASDYGVVSTIDWLKQELNEGDVVAFSGGEVPQQMATEWIEALRAAKITCKTELDPVEEIWEDRPDAPCGEFYMVPDSFTGETSAEKLQRVREAMKAERVDAYLLGRTDESNWLLNFRGTDIPGVTTPLCFTLVQQDSAEFFVDPGKLTSESRALIEAAGFTLRGYDEIDSALKALSSDTRLLMVPNYTNYNLYQAGSHCDLVKGRAIVTDLKGVKNPTEQKNIREIMLHDGAAMVKFYTWFYAELAAGRSTSELAVSRKLLECRKLIPTFRHTSFDSIVGYKHHGALNHYSVDEESSLEIIPGEGSLLIDNGGNYENGTSDTTRVIPVGEPSAQLKKEYTMVLQCLINLITTEFPEGTTGAQLDGVCRHAMWQHHAQFLHGTGHGVGYGTEVHEGPQNISGRTTELMKQGMLTTIEPGLYRTGEYGIRLENMVIAVDSGEAGFGKFMKFENVTFCPLNTDLVDASMLEERQLQWLNNYNAEVLEKLTPFLEPNEIEWLTHECRPLSV